MSRSAARVWTLVLAYLPPERSGTPLTQTGSPVLHKVDRVRGDGARGTRKDEMGIEGEFWGIVGGPVLHRRESRGRPEDLKGRADRMFDISYKHE